MYVCCEVNIYIKRDKYGINNPEYIILFINYTKYIYCY